MRVSAENRRFIHIIPEGVKIVWAFKVFVLELGSPVILSVFVKEVHISYVSWPAPVVVILEFRCSYKDIGHVTLWLHLVLKLKSISIDLIILAHTNMRVDDDCDAAIARLKLLIQLLNLTTSKILWIKNEVLICSFAVLIWPFDVRPKHIDWEFMLSKVTISFHQHFSTHVSPLAEMETKYVDWGHWNVTRNYC